MSTVEDVFFLYEQPTNACLQESPLLPMTIGDQEIPCNFKRKCYVRPGEECPICFEEIQTKKTAYITGCGHVYHKVCLRKYMECKWLSTKYTSNTRCPLCRSLLGHPELEQRYRASYFSFCEEQSATTELDKLEDFWISHECKIPAFCSHGYDHYLGMDKDCFLCLQYREKGAILYEL